MDDYPEIGGAAAAPEFIDALTSTGEDPTGHEQEQARAICEALEEYDCPTVQEVMDVGVRVLGFREAERRLEAALGGFDQPT